ncbi:glycosyltransferase family 1 protein [Halobacterium salinarum]|uniref:glycosyltransferase family 4 protein n=1 Tax=Halobacterium salinarum TaxID=2242 RepID=UPI002555DBF3|nr:glycosyltransferase family 1 protein [Halobacterium salinarum]MDL0131501.1 glycosyltransferase family 1 protein [Halobacterium salinarum]
MEIGIATSYLDLGVSGPAVYRRNLIENLQKVIDEEDTIYLIHYRESDDPIYEKFQEVIIPQPPILSKISKKFYEVERLEAMYNIYTEQFIESKLDLDVLHMQFLPYKRFYWLKNPSFSIVTTLHGIHESFQQSTVPSSRWLLKFYLRNISAIFTVSKWSKNELSEAGIPKEDIFVTENAPRKGVKRIDDISILPDPIPENYIFHLSSVHERKNPGGILQGWSKAVENGLNYDLVIAGNGWDEYDLPQWAIESDSVHILGFITNEILSALYTNAEVFLFPSFEEGFGLPALEAMYCGTPVVAGNGGALPEVVNGGGVIVDPHNFDEIASGIQQATQIDEKKILAAAGDYSWEKTAKKTFEMYKQVSN